MVPMPEASVVVASAAQLLGRTLDPGIGRERAARALAAAFTCCASTGDAQVRRRLVRCRLDRGRGCALSKRGLIRHARDHAGESRGKTDAAPADWRVDGFGELAPTPGQPVERPTGISAPLEV